MRGIFINSEVKKSTFILSLVITVFIGLQGIVYFKGISEEKQRYIDVVGGVLYKAIEIDPTLEKELVPLVTKELTNDDKLNGNEILKEYGITSDLHNSLFPNYNNNYGLILLAILFGIAILLLNYFQFSNFFKKIRRLTMAANKIVDEEYGVLINEDREGDFSKLALAFTDVRSIIKNNLNTMEMEKVYLVEVLQNISHQLKTKLATLLLYNDILLNRNLTEEQRNHFISDNGKQLNNMNDIIQRILKLAKLDASAVEFYKKELNLNKTIEEVIFLLKPLAIEKEIDLKITTNEAIEFQHDKFWMQEGITNIIKNAIDHTPSKGSIDVSLLNSPVFYRIIIRDTGEGISKEDTMNIFNRFYKSKNSKSDSVGIGLPITNSIVKGHNGYIDVESEEGKGTSFIITFMKY
ncbi:MAG: sensor histidine kinase [Clostridium sp.]